MNSSEEIVALLIQISTVVGVQVAIWWPRKVKVGTATAHAFRALRIASGCLMLGFALLIATTGLPLLPPETTLLQQIIFGATLGTVPLTPLSSVALSLERGRRFRALFSTYGALLFAAVLAWLCLIRGLVFLNMPGQPWQAVCIAIALLSCAIAMVFIMEVYTAIRQPKPSA